MSEEIDLDEYIKMWNDHSLGSEGVQDLMNALIAKIDSLESAHARELKIIWRLHDDVCETLDKTLLAWHEEKQKNETEG